jgi:hypothetical protein
MSGSNPPWLAKKFNLYEGEFGDYGAAGLLQACVECHAGSGWSEYDRHGLRYDQTPDSLVQHLDGDYFNRGTNPISATTAVNRWDWKKSGVMEADCMLCHGDLSNLRKFSSSRLGDNDGLDHSASAYQHWNDLRNEKLGRGGFFRDIGSAIWEFLNLRPDLPEGLALLDFAREIVPNTSKPDYQLILDGESTPVIHWNKNAFDQNGKLTLPMRRFPASENCMICHVTSHDRRGFYGFGDEAKPIQQPDGSLVADFKNDIHKGKSFTEDNGETRVINNCNACHAKQYFRPTFANVDLDADHNFPKGNGDADVRNDLDHMPGPTSCEHCHDTARHPALPSGQKNVLDAHSEIWKANGDMVGYPENTLRKITQTHLDVVACQTCHINQLAKADGTPLPIHYRYRLGTDRKQKIFPYQPAFRYYARDKASGRVLYQFERNSVFEERNTEDGAKYGAIIDPSTRQELGRVAINAKGFADPTTYEGFKALKQAYDRLMQAKAYSSADVRFVYVDSNEYVISHNTRPSPQAVQCSECHGKNSIGSFSPRLSANGLLGENRKIEVAKLPDRRLIDEGLFEFGMPYHQVDDSGRILESVTDVLYASRLDSSMSILKSEKARAIAGEFKRYPADQSSVYAGLDGAVGTRILQRLNSGEWLLFNSQIGNPSLRGFALILAGNLRNRILLEKSRVEVESREVTSTDRKRVKKRGFGFVSSDIYSIEVSDANRLPLTDVAGSEILLKIPYRGYAERIKQLRIVYSDDSKRWRKMPRRNILELHPPSGSQEGYVIFSTDRLFANWTIADKKRFR